MTCDARDEHSSAPPLLLPPLAPDLALALAWIREPPSQRAHSRCSSASSVCRLPRCSWTSSSGESIHAAMAGSYLGVRVRVRLRSGRESNRLRDAMAKSYNLPLGTLWLKIELALGFGLSLG